MDLWAKSRSTLPSKSAIFQARSRLGPEPLKVLFSKVATPLAKEGTPGAWLGGRRVVAIDGTCLDVADTPENAAFFGRPGVNKGEQAAFPQARIVALAECGTHAIFDAVVGAYTTQENTAGARPARAVGAGDAAAGRPWVLRVSPLVTGYFDRCRSFVAGQRPT